jgi:hypothetical protein
MAFLRTGVAILAVVISHSALQAANGKGPAPQVGGSSSGGLFSGTPEEQAACSPDAVRFCRDDLPDTFRVLACLQKHREKLRKACRNVLEDHGQ